MFMLRMAEFIPIRSLSVSMASNSGHGFGIGDRDAANGSTINVDADGGGNCKRVQDTIENTVVDHTFVFTHCGFCGHNVNGEESHDQNDQEFIEWANGLTTNPIEAVFCGHTHEPWICFDVDNSDDGEVGGMYCRYYEDGNYMSDKDKNVYDHFEVEYDVSTIWYIDSDNIG